MKTEVHPFYKDKPNNRFFKQVRNQNHERN